MKLTETTLTDWAEKHGIENLTEEAAAEFVKIIQSAPPSFEHFNQITDLRPYLARWDKGDAKVDCLWLLGDDAQKWWNERKENDAAMSFDKSFFIVDVDGRIENDNTVKSIK